MIKKYDVVIDTIWNKILEETERSFSFMKKAVRIRLVVCALVVGVAATATVGVTGPWRASR